MANTALQVLRTSTSGRTPNTTASYATNSAYIGAGGLALNMADGILFSSNGTSGNLFTVGQNSYTYYASNGLVTIVGPSTNAARSIYTGYGQGVGGGFGSPGNGTGFGIYLNYNITGNKQLIFADPDNLTSNVLRIGVISGAISIDSLNSSGGGTSANVVFGSGIIVQQGVYANDGNQSYFSAINATGNINAASYTTTGITINATAIVPTSNSSGQTLGNSISRFVLSANTIDATGAITGTTANLSTSVNSALLTVGTSFSANTSKVFFGNSISNTTITGTPSVLLQNSTSQANLTSATLTIGTTIANASAVAATLISGTANVSIGSSANLTFASGAKIIDSTASQGTAGQVLTSNGTGNVYWSTVASGSTNVAAQYTWTNTQTFSNTITFSSTAASGNATSGAIQVTGGVGVANNVYVGGRVGFSNSTNISVVYQYYNLATTSLDTVFG